MNKNEIKAILDSYEQVGCVNTKDGYNLPSRQGVNDLLSKIKELLFPGYFEQTNLGDHNLEFVIGNRVVELKDQLHAEILKSLCWNCDTKKDCQAITKCHKHAKDISANFIIYIPELRKMLKEDIGAIFNGDPAAKSEPEVILSYPGFQAITAYRVANFLYKNHVPFIPRLMMEILHGETGIDIHPGATIGKGFCIDHGTGVVIGETSIIGDNVKLYQGVTIGALSVHKNIQGKRHPTIEDNVTIYARTTILGGETIIGENSIIGGNVWLTNSVPPNSKIYLTSDNKQVFKTK
jgi:serine O-acetyltransferase